MKKKLNIVSCRYEGDNGYTVLLCDEINEEGKAVSCSLICIGYFLPTKKNRVFVAELEETESKKYGKQYSVRRFEMEDPKDKIGMVDVILSCKLKGIGKKKAEKIVERFGKDTLHVLDTDFTRIREIKNMPKDLETPQTQWKNSRDYRQMMAIIGSNVNISQRKLLKIRNYFKEDTLNVIKNRPYDVMRVRGVDFDSADSIAMNCEEYPFSYNDYERIKAGIKQSLLDGMLEGHLFLYTEQIIQKAKKILEYDKTFVNADDIKKCLNLLVKYEDISFVRFTREFGFYLKSNYIAEQNAAEKVASMVFSENESKVTSEDVEMSISKHEISNNIKLAKGQRNAVNFALNEKVSIITGGPGRGKTTVLNMILKVYKQFYPKDRILLMAPTGRAARRMSETTGMNASTIHSALELRSDDEMDNIYSGEQDETLDADFIIIDEMSMVDQRLFSILIAKIKKECRLVFVGDKDQLASVGAGNVFAELIASNVIPTTVLDTPFRQDENDLVYINAEKINKGDTRLIEGNTFKIIDAVGENDIRDKCIEAYQYYLNRNHNDLDSIFLLSPFRRRTEIGSNRLNESLQKCINITDNKLVVNAYGKRFCKGDKVMQIKNITTDDFALSNGDIGYVSELSAGLNNDSSVTVEFDEVGIKEYSDRDDFDMLELAYATTVHKAQGSEAKTVIIPMSKIFSGMLQKSIIYTAVSRAKINVVIVGERDALNYAIRNMATKKRNTLFAWRLQREKYKREEKKKDESSGQLSFAI